MEKATCILGFIARTTPTIMQRLVAMIIATYALLPTIVTHLV